MICERCEQNIATYRAISDEVDWAICADCAEEIAANPGIPDRPGALTIKPLEDI